MAPLKEAIKVDYASSGTDTEKIYQGTVDGSWCIGSVPNGGFSLALLLEACIQYQSSTRHPDPINVTAHYLQSVQVTKFQVKVKTIKTGRGFSNITADLVQNDRVKITAHIIFGILEPSPNEPGPHLTLEPPSPYARRHPLHQHPSKSSAIPLRKAWGFSAISRMTRDPVYAERNEPTSSTRTNSNTVGGGGLDWAGWFELTSEGEKITTPSLCFLADIFVNSVALLPEDQRKGLGESWFPTMVLNIEFKFPIPRFPSSDHATRTVGVFSTSNFINDPQGRHDNYVEVWTAPSNIGEGEERDGWRDKQRCLAISSQMALAIPMAVNRRNVEKLSKM